MAEGEKAVFEWRTRSRLCAAREVCGVLVMLQITPCITTFPRALRFKSLRLLGCHCRLLPAAPAPVSARSQKQKRSGRPCFRDACLPLRALLYHRSFDAGKYHIETVAIRYHSALQAINPAAAKGFENFLEERARRARHARAFFSCQAPLSIPTSLRGPRFLFPVPVCAPPNSSALGAG